MENIKYNIILDFDGTCVEFRYPEIGRCNFGCIEVLYKLQKAGHKIKLNTYRANCKNSTLEKAIEWFEDAWMFLDNASKRNSFFENIEIKIDEVFDKKENPHSWDWNYIKENKIIYIDDMAPNIPLKINFSEDGKVVDWYELDKQFIEQGLY